MVVMDGGSGRDGRGGRGRRGGLGSPLSAKLDVSKLVHFVEGERTARERVLIGSVATLGASRTEWERLGYVVAVNPHRGPEHFVDDALHAQLMQTAAKTFAPPRVLALLTGDGNCNEGRTTFPQCVERALANGWHVELISWRQSTNTVYKAFEREYPHLFRIRYLDGAI